MILRIDKQNNPTQFIIPKNCLNSDYTDERMGMILRTDKQNNPTHLTIPQITVQTKIMRMKRLV